MEVDPDDSTVLIHFEGWNQRYDEWMDMSSERLRPLARHSERKEKKPPARQIGKATLVLTFYPPPCMMPALITLFLQMEKLLM